MEGIGIDINCDVGEGLDNEEALFPYISRCSIACGGHAGDENYIRKLIKLAKINNVRVGAHPSYPDKENFGRKVLEISQETLQESIVSQLNLIFDIANDEKVIIDHVKPHGALYNEAVKNEKVVSAIISAMEKTRLKAKLLVPDHAIIATIARKSGIEVISEAFADRNYNDDLSLVSRSNPNATIESPEIILAHLLMMINGEVKTISGVSKPIKASSFCIHGDNKNVEKILTYLFNELPKKNIYVLK